MGSLIFGLKRLEYLATYFLKLKTPLSRGGFQKSVHTNRILFSNITKHFIIHDLRASSQVAKNADFGKVVDLDFNFDELMVDDNYSDGVEFKEKQLDKKSIKKTRQFEKTAKTKKFEGMKLDEKEIENEVVLEPDEIEYQSENNEVKKQNFHLSKTNKKTFSNDMAALKSRKVRKESGKIVLEGKRLIQDAIFAGHKPLKIYFSRFSDLRTLNLPEDVTVTQVHYKTLSLWSDVITSQGLIGVFKKPELRKSNVHSSGIPLTVICDNIRDPGNLGSIIRIVAAVGGQELILTNGCVDPWDPKVLRSGAGAHFNLPIVNNFSWSDIEDIIPAGIQVVLADIEVSMNSNEGSKEKKEPENCAKNSFFKNSSELANNLPLYCYTSFSYEAEGTVIILGGETCGLSDEAYQFAINRNGSRVYIPMGNATESLNNAVSLGIISYECRRQLNYIISKETPEGIIDEGSSAVDKS